MLFAKWDSLVKHVGYRKVAKDIGIDVKKGDWYYFKVCRHVENQKLFASRGCEFTTIQVAHGVVGECKESGPIYHCVAFVATRTSYVGI